jgi:hypothetical protein
MFKITRKKYKVQDDIDELKWLEQITEDENLRNTYKTLREKYEAAQVQVKSRSTVTKRL